MTLTQIIYSSRPFGFDSAMLSGILMTSRRNNERDGITGALICRRDIYLQLLEGPEKAIDAALDRIRRDDRHLEVTLLNRATVTDRMFADWAMLDDPARSWFLTPDQIADGALERSSADEVLAMFAKLSAETQDAPQS